MASPKEPASIKGESEEDRSLHVLATEIALYPYLFNYLSRLSRLFDTDLIRKCQDMVSKDKEDLERYAEINRKLDELQQENNLLSSANEIISGLEPTEETERTRLENESKIQGNNIQIKALEGMRYATEKQMEERAPLMALALPTLDELEAMEGYVDFCVNNELKCIDMFINEVNNIHNLVQDIRLENIEHKVQEMNTPDFLDLFLNLTFSLSVFRTLVATTLKGITGNVYNRMHVVTKSRISPDKITNPALRSIEHREYKTSYISDDFKLMKTTVIAQVRPSADGGATESMFPNLLFVNSSTARLELKLSSTLFNEISVTLKETKAIAKGFLRAGSMPGIRKSSGDILYEYISNIILAFECDKLALQQKRDFTKSRIRKAVYQWIMMKDKEDKVKFSNKDILKLPDLAYLFHSFPKQSLSLEYCETVRIWGLELELMLWYFILPAPPTQKEKSTRMTSAGHAFHKLYDFPMDELVRKHIINRLKLVDRYLEDNIQNAAIAFVDMATITQNGNRMPTLIFNRWLNEQVENNRKEAEEHWVAHYLNEAAKSLQKLP